MLVARDIVVRRAGRIVLDRVCAEVRPGRVLGILGPNGAGKSTLFAALAGDLEPASGRVALGDCDMSSLDIGARARRRAVLRQATGLAFDYRVEEVVAMGLHPRGLDGSGPRGRAILSAVTEATGTDAFRARGIATLSGGEAQRVQLARVLAQVWPAADESGAERYLLLDEPTASLDLKHQHALMATVRRVATTSLGIAVVLHDPALAFAYADEILLIKAGRALGSPRAPPDIGVGELAELYDVPRELIALAARPSGGSA
jgi:iron complex transport system ATP-binding protein